MIQDIKELLALLPQHWEIIPPDTSNEFCDDGRDYDKPMFMRKDKLARIYFNKDEDNSKYTYAIAWDEHGDGDCRGDFAYAIKIADDYVNEYPLT